MRIGKKLLIGLGVLFVIIIVGAIAVGGIIIGSIGSAINEEQKFKDELFEGLTDSPKAAQASYCGVGTVYDESSNTCFLG